VVDNDAKGVCVLKGGRGVHRKPAFHQLHDSRLTTMCLCYTI
jgi:hypothetical protein